MVEPTHLKKYAREIGSFPRDRDENYMYICLLLGENDISNQPLAFLVLPQPPRHHDFLWPQDEVMPKGGEFTLPEV